MNVIGLPLSSLGRFFSWAGGSVAGLATDLLAGLSDDDESPPDDPWLIDDSLILEEA
jgi:hypothetical protein